MSSTIDIEKGFNFIIQEIILEEGSFLKETTSAKEENYLSNELFLKAKIIFRLWGNKTKEKTNLYLLIGDYKETKINNKDYFDSLLKEYFKTQRRTEVKENEQIIGSLFVEEDILNECY